MSKQRVLIVHVVGDDVTARQALADKIAAEAPGLGYALESRKPIGRYIDGETLLMTRASWVETNADRRLDLIAFAKQGEPPAAPLLDLTDDQVVAALRSREASSND